MPAAKRLARTWGSRQVAASRLEYHLRHRTRPGQAESSYEPEKLGDTMPSSPLGLPEQGRAGIGMEAR